MEDKVVKTFTKDKTDFETEKGGGVSVSITWEAMMYFLRHTAHAKPEEEVTGVVVTKDGIKIKLETRKD